MSLLEKNFTLSSLELGDNPNVPENHSMIIKKTLSFNNQYRNLKLRNDKFEFGHNLMAEGMRTWALGDMFV